MKEVLVNFELFKVSLNLSLMVLRVQILLFVMKTKEHLSLLMLTELFSNSLTITKFTRI